MAIQASLYIPDCEMWSRIDWVPLALTPEMTLLVSMYTQSIPIVPSRRHTLN